MLFGLQHIHALIDGVVFRCLQLHNFLHNHFSFLNYSIFPFSAGHHE